MKILITGAKGFVGKNLVEFFNKDDRYKEYIELYNKLLGYK